MAKKIAVDITMIVEVPDDFNDQILQTMKVKDISFEYIVASQTFDVHDVKIVQSEILDTQYQEDSDMVSLIGEG